MGAGNGYVYPGHLVCKRLRGESPNTTIKRRKTNPSKSNPPTPTCKIHPTRPKRRVTRFSRWRLEVKVDRVQLSWESQSCPDQWCRFAHTQCILQIKKTFKIKTRNEKLKMAQLDFFPSVHWRPIASQCRTAGRGWFFWGRPILTGLTDGPLASELLCCRRRHNREKREEEERERERERKIE